MSVKSKYADPIANYNPEKHGTVKEYCESLGLDYLGYRKALYNQRKKAGLPSRKLTDYKPYFEELIKTEEPVKQFCKRNHLVYQNFRVAWYRYRKARGLVQERGAGKSEDTGSSIFTGENDFYEIKERED